MKLKFIYIYLILFSASIFSQTEEFYSKKTQKGFGKIDFLSIKLPTDPSGFINPNMGFSGIHYNLHLNDWGYAGLGIYGAVSGNKGGFFTLGFNAGIKKYYKNFYLDTGFHFGGGGGAGAPDGGGAFILPHFNIGYNFNFLSINSGWSYVDFFDAGNIKGHQLNFAVEIPLDYDYTNYKYSEKTLTIQSLKKSKWNQALKRNSLMLHQNNLKIKGDSKNTRGKIYNGEVIKLAGFEIASYFNNNWFAFLKTDGAYDGIDAGYMDVFIGVGHRLLFNRNKTNILAKFGIGAGGGGGVDTKGGFLIYPDLSIEQKIFDEFYISINKGYVMTPDSYFLTSSLGFGLKYYVNRNGIKFKNKKFSKAKLKGLGIILKHDLYFNASRITNPTENLHQISLQINLDLNKNFYVAGQTSFANFGNAGAYAEGIVGLGGKTNSVFNNSTTIFTQILFGAAGGGNISTGEGLIIKPSLGVNYKLNNHLNFRGAIGHVKAKGGSLNSTFINFGIKYNFSLLNVK